MPENESNSLFAELAGRIFDSRHANGLGIGMLRSGSNWAECYLDWRQELVTNLQTGILASGPIISLMDTVCGIAVRCALEEPSGSVVTLDLRVDYLRPARPERRVIGVAECYHLTQRIAFVRGTAHDGEPDRPVASVTGSFIFTAG